MTQVGIWFLSGLLLFGHRTASVTLAWDPARDKEIVGYRIYYTDITGHKAAKAKSLDVGLTTHAGIPNLVAGHTYYFAVRAINSSGRESLPSNLLKYVAG
jgi:predicted phage tail protein